MYATDEDDKSPQILKKEKDWTLTDPDPSWECGPDPQARKMTKIYWLNVKTDIQPFKKASGMIYDVIPTDPH